MISKQKRNTILAYCIASVIILSLFASAVAPFSTKLSSTKKVATEGNNYLEIEEEEEVSYGLVAMEASQSIKKEENTEFVTEEKKEDNSSKDDKNKESEKKEVKKTTQKKTTAKKTTKKVTTKKVSKKKVVKKSSTPVKVPAKGNVELGKQIVSYAKRFIGNPYRMGGTSLTKGADCSGFTQSVFKNFGIKIPRTVASQARVGRYVPWNYLQPGDLVFYSNGGRTPTHVAIYIGGGKIIHAQTPKHGIGITTYKIMTRITARRVV